MLSTKEYDFQAKKFDETLWMVDLDKAAALGDDALRKHERPGVSDLEISRAARSTPACRLRSQNRSALEANTRRFCFTTESADAAACFRSICTLDPNFSAGGVPPHCERASISVESHLLTAVYVMRCRV